MKRLDRESASERQFDITVKAYDRGVPSLADSANIKIEVSDVNDNEPYFDSALYVAGTFHKQLLIYTKAQAT